MAYLGRSPRHGFLEGQTHTFSGSDTSITLLRNVSSTDALDVFIDNVHQEPDVAYTLSSGGDQITFTGTPLSGQKAYIRFHGLAFDTARANALTNTPGTSTLTLADAHTLTLDLNGTTALTATTSGVTIPNLTVTGTTTTVNSTQLNIGDNLITLNSDLGSGVAPSENAGIEVNRGSASDVSFLWNESNDYWQASETLVSLTQLAVLKSGTTPSLAATTLGVFKNSAANQDAAISIIANSGQSSAVNFGDENDEDVGQLSYSHTSELFALNKGITVAGHSRINGDFSVSAASGEDRFAILPQPAGNGSILFSGNAGLTGYEPLTVDFESLALRTSGVERFAVLTSGNIGLGKDLATTTVSKIFSTGHASANRGKNVAFGLDDGAFAGIKIVNAAAANSSFNSQSIEFITHEGAVSVGTRMKIDSVGNTTFFGPVTGTSATFNGQFTANSGNNADVAFFDSTNATTTNFYIRNSRATTGNAAAIYLAPANNVAGAYVQAVATEDFSANANRSAKLVFGVRKDGTFSEALTLADSRAATFASTISSGAITNTGTHTVTHNAGWDTQTNMQLALRDTDNTNMRANFMVDKALNSNRGGLAIQATEAGVTNDRDLALQPHGGRVGVLTAYPSYPLHVNGAAYVNGNLRVTGSGTPGADFFINGNSDGGSQAGIHLYAVDTNHSIFLRRGNDNTLNTTDFHQFGKFRFYTDGVLASQTRKMEITAGGDVEVPVGNVLVGATSFSQPGVSLGNSGDLRCVYSNGAGGDTFISAIGGVSFGYRIQVGTNNAITYKWHNGLTNNMTLDSTGRMQVGNATIDGGRITSAYSSFVDTGSNNWKKGAFVGTGLYGGAISLINSGGSSDGFAFYLTGNPSVLNIRRGANNGALANGVQLSSTATAFAAYSDERLKTVTGEISGAVESVKSLRAVKYTFTEDEEKTARVGLIAQEVQKVLPEAVDVIDEDGHLGIRYTEVIPLLVKAIQELAEKVDEQAAKIAALGGN